MICINGLSSCSCSSFSSRSSSSLLLHVHGLSYGKPVPVSFPRPSYIFSAFRMMYHSVPSLAIYREPFLQRTTVFCCLLFWIIQRSIDLINLSINEFCLIYFLRKLWRLISFPFSLFVFLLKMTKILLQQQYNNTS